MPLAPVLVEQELVRAEVCGRDALIAFAELERRKNKPSA